ncbi:MAG: hypothetical protein QOH90_1502 [Actinomycetota bacterium]|jgi:sporulation protein YlmC with PRC-barrel domain|nr:hypothetical protein [Actinomycetota bacterium]
MAGQKMDAGLDILDVQIVDKDGRMSGVVDDLDFSWDEETGAPYVSSILSGPEALGTRLGGRIGLWMASVHARLHDREDPGPAKISIGVVKKISNHVEITVSREDLDISRSPDWARDTIISKIPGADRAVE